MVLAITVAPRGAGWTVTSGLFDNEMYFRSGAKAEAAAQSLARKIAHADAPVEVQIYLRDGSVAARRRVTPPSGDAPTRALRDAVHP